MIFCCSFFLSETLLIWGYFQILLQKKTILPMFNKYSEYSRSNRSSVALLLKQSQAVKYQYKPKSADTYSGETIYLVHYIALSLFHYFRDLDFKLLVIQEMSVRWYVVKSMPDKSTEQGLWIFWGTSSPLARRSNQFKKQVYQCWINFDTLYPHFREKPLIGSIIST